MAYYGTKIGQDARFKNPDTDILSSMKIPKIYKTTVSKHNLIILPIIKLWLNKKINEILEFEDETLTNLIINLIKSSKEKIEPKIIQYQISGFLGDKTYSFMKQFWKLLINIQELYVEDKNKIPDELLPFQEEFEKKKQFFNKKKFEKKENYYEDLKSNANYNEEIINIDDNRSIDNYKESEKIDYKIKDYYYKRSQSRSLSREDYNYRKRKRSRNRSRKRNSRSESNSIKYEKKRYKNKSRSRHKRYNYSRSRNSSRSKRNGYKSRSRSRSRSKRRTRSRNSKKIERTEKIKRYKEDIKYKNINEKEVDDDTFSNHSKRNESRNLKKKEFEENNNKNKSFESDSSSETLKLEQKSLISDSSSDENQTKSFREK